MPERNWKADLKPLAQIGRNQFGNASLTLMLSLQNSPMLAGWRKNPASLWSESVGMLAVLLPQLHQR